MRSEQEVLSHNSYLVASKRLRNWLVYFARNSVTIYGNWGMREFSAS